MSLVPKQHRQWLWADTKWAPHHLLPRPSFIFPEEDFCSLWKAASPVRMRHRAGFALQFVLTEQHLKTTGWFYLWNTELGRAGEGFCSCGKRECRMGSNESHRHPSACRGETRLILTKWAGGVSSMRKCLPLKFTITVKLAKLRSMISSVCCTLYLCSSSAVLPSVQLRHELWFGTAKSFNNQSLCMQLLSTN